MTVLAIPDPDNNQNYIIPGGPVGEDETPEQAACRHLEEQTGVTAVAAVYLYEDEEDGDTVVTMDMEYSIPRRRVDRDKIREDAKFVGPVNVVSGPQGDYNWKVLVDLLGMDFTDVIDEVMDC
jgi:8-oxo-dGTP pyrophosphatase MutT (NUDIX family)